MKEFQSCTFSGFKQSDVRTQLMKCLMLETSMEEACFWSAQLLASGHLMDIWETFLSVMAKQIHLANPKLPLYMDMRFTQFREFLMGVSAKSSYLGREHDMRNHKACRELIAEVCGILCASRKKQAYKPIKVKQTDFDMFHLPTLLRAPTPTYIKLPSELFPNGVWTEGDPTELMVASNELAFHVSKDGKDERRAWYWVEWILAYLDLVQKTSTTKGKAGKTQKQSCICSPRKHCVGGRELSREILGHPVWLIWDILLHETSKRHHPHLGKVIKPLLDLFGMKFTKGCVKKRKFMLYMAISLLCEPVDWEVPILADTHKPLVLMAKERINLIYRQLKKDEIVQTKDDLASAYLFDNAVLPLSDGKSNSSTKTTPTRTDRQSTQNTQNTQQTYDPNPYNIPYPSSPKQGMPPTLWEQNQVAQMIVERDDTRMFY